MFTLDEIRNIMPMRLDGTREPIVGKELVIEADVTEWFLVQSASSSAKTVVYSHEVELKLLGDPSRTFKPDMPNHVYVSLIFCLSPEYPPVLNVSQSKKKIVMNLHLQNLELSTAAQKKCSITYQ